MQLSKRRFLILSGTLAMIAALFLPKRFSGAADRQPSNDRRLYIGLFHRKSYLPGAEVSGAGYSRVSISRLSAPVDWRVLDDGTFANVSEIVFPRCESDWGEVRFFGLCRGLHSPPWRWIEINNPTHLMSAEQAVFPKGNLA